MEHGNGNASIKAFMVTNVSKAKAAILLSYPFEYHAFERKISHFRGK